VEPVADLDGVRSAAGDALAVDRGAVAARDLHTRMLLQPVAQRLHVASFLQRDR
jgi:hypothetical protein